MIIVIVCLVNKYILLTKHEGRTGRISARGQDGPEQAWLIRDLLYDWNCLEEKPKW